MDKKKLYELIDEMLSDDNIEWICQADGEDINKFKGVWKRKFLKISKGEKE